ncbi:MAG: Fur family transcriptional regulator [Acidimicrobiales bacterium]
MPPADHRHPDTAPPVDDAVEAILERLRADGGRITTGRRAIVRALLTAEDHHVTAEDVATVVQADHPDVHLSTVYRTLDALDHLEVVDRIDLGTGSAVYHLTDRAHHHLVCEECGSVTEADDAAFRRLGADLAKAFGFTLSGQHLSLTGRCATCRERRGSPG